MGLPTKQQNDFYEKYWNKIEICTDYDVSMFVRDYLSVKQQLIPSMSKVYFTFKAFVEDNGTEIEPLLQELLKLSPEEDVYCLKRQRLIQGLPYCLEESYYSKRHVLYLNEEIGRASVFTYLQEDLKLSFGFADIYFRISNLSKEHAPLLNQRENDATLLTESIYYLHNGEPFNYSVLRYHKDQAQFFVPSLRY